MGEQQSSEAYTLVVPASHTGERLDRFLRQALPALSRVALRELFARGHVRRNGRAASKSSEVASGDRIEIAGLPAQSGPAADPSLSLRIVYEDRFLVVVDKPGSVPSHALRAGETGTVVSALLARYPELRGVGYRELESGLLHRLDNETSGILVAARDAETFEQLRKAHARGEFTKRYLALVAGPPPALQRAQAYLRADKRKVRVRLEAFEGAKPIETELVSSEAHGGMALVCVQLALAARHQVRAHLAALGHPIAGDDLYGGPSLPGLDRHFLHASELELPHPEGHRLRVRAELPQALQDVLASLA